MKKYFALFCCFAVFLALSDVSQALARADASSLPKIGDKAEETLFAKSIEDLPLMKGLEIVEDKDLIFLFGKERIAQTTLNGKVDVDNVYYFYSDVLPSLGWKKVTMKLYERGGEQLRLNASSVKSADALTHVTFEVSPLK